MNISYVNTISVEDYNKLHIAVGWGARDPGKVREALGRTDFLVAARTDGKTIGMARVIQDGLQALIMDVIVTPEYQRQGIGKAMMTRLMDYLGEQSRSGGLLVNLMSAINREGFYGQFGFERRPSEKRGPGMTLWVDKKV